MFPLRAEGEFEARLHAAATRPGWSGWMADLVKGPQGAPAPAASAPQQKRKKLRAVSSQQYLEAMAAASEEEVAAEWGAAHDPLAAAEGWARVSAENAAARCGREGAACARVGLLVPGLRAARGSRAARWLRTPLPGTGCRREQVAAVQAGWQALQQDAALRSSFLTQPLKAARGGFTRREIG